MLSDKVFKPTFFEDETHEFAADVHVKDSPCEAITIEFDGFQCTVSDKGAASIAMTLLEAVTDFVKNTKYYKEQ